MPILLPILTIPALAAAVLLPGAVTFVAAVALSSLVGAAYARRRRSAGPAFGPAAFIGR